jgi:hypothetical protein
MAVQSFCAPHYKVGDTGLVGGSNPPPTEADPDGAQGGPVPGSFH